VSYRASGSDMPRASHRCRSIVPSKDSNPAPLRSATRSHKPACSARRRFRSIPRCRCSRPRRPSRCHPHRPYHRSSLPPCRRRHLSPRRRRAVRLESLPCLLPPSRLVRSCRRCHRCRHGRRRRRSRCCRHRVANDRRTRRLQAMLRSRSRRQSSLSISTASRRFDRRG